MNDEQEKSNGEIELRGRLKTDILSKTSASGNVFYYVFIRDEEERDIPIFFWLDNFAYEEQEKIQELRKSQSITVRGFYRKTRNYVDSPLFHVKSFEILEEETEIF